MPKLAERVSGDFFGEKGSSLGNCHYDLWSFPFVACLFTDLFIDRSASVPPMTSNFNSVNGSPSVPMSVYKELAAELQATRVMVDSLNQKNQQLTQQNQAIRQEVERVVQASFNLQQIVEFTTPVGVAVDPMEERFARSTAPDPLLSNQWLTEEPSRPYKIPKEPKKPRDLGNFGMGLTILLVVLTAFGLGFVAVKQLLPSR
jgi:hypothetical protein